MKANFWVFRNPKLSHLKVITISIIVYLLLIIFVGVGRSKRLNALGDGKCLAIVCCRRYIYTEYNMYYRNENQLSSVIDWAKLINQRCWWPVVLKTLWTLFIADDESLSSSLGSRKACVGASFNSSDADSQGGSLRSRTQGDIGSKDWTCGQNSHMPPLHICTLSYTLYLYLSHFSRKREPNLTMFS